MQSGSCCKCLHNILSTSMNIRTVSRFSFLYFPPFPFPFLCHFIFPRPFTVFSLFPLILFFLSISAFSFVTLLCYSFFEMFFHSSVLLFLRLLCSLPSFLPSFLFSPFLSLLSVLFKVFFINLLLS